MSQQPLRRLRSDFAHAPPAAVPITSYMERSQRADIGALVDVARRARAVRAAALRFLELHEQQRQTAPLVVELLDELIAPGCARLEAELARGRRG